MREANTVGARSDSWLTKVARVLNRRFETDGPDRPLVELAQAGLDREVWRPLMLWHMTRREFLVRDFLVGWLYPQYRDGVLVVRAEDAWPYLRALPASVIGEKPWTERTVKRVASGLLRIAADFGLMSGKVTREFATYRLPDPSFLYLLHAMRERLGSPGRIIECPDWRMYLMSPADVEQELLRLHQFRKLHYEVAGTLRQLELPCESLEDYVKELRCE